MILANLKPGSDARTTEAAIRTNLERHHGVRVQSHDEIQAANRSDSDKVVALVDAMLALSLIISLFGIVNTLILSVLERTREIGLMRAVGASRRQVRRAVRYESVLTAYVGGVLGLGLGVAVAALVVHALEDAVLGSGRPADPAGLGLHHRRHPRRCAARPPGLAPGRARRPRAQLTRRGTRGPETCVSGPLVSARRADVAGARAARRSACARTRSARRARRRARPGWRSQARARPRVISTDAEGRDGQPRVREAVHVAPAEGDVREQVERRAAEQRGRRNDAAGARARGRASS